MFIHSTKKKKPHTHKKMIKRKVLKKIFLWKYKRNSYFRKIDKTINSGEHISLVKNTLSPASEISYKG